MASSIVSCRDNTGEPGSTERQILVSLNILIAAIDTLCAKMDLDAGITDTNYTTLVANLNKRIGDMAGNALLT